MEAVEDSKIIAKHIVEKELNEVVVNIERMTTGICNEVFVLSLPDRKVVVRMNKLESQMLGSEKYIPLFNEIGIKVPDIITSNYKKDFYPYAYQILSWIDGEDLGKIINSLNDEQLISLAKEISQIFKKLSALPTDGRYGFIGYGENKTYGSCLELWENMLGIVQKRNSKTGIVDDLYINVFKTILNKYKEYLETVPSIFYYGDINSKNVLMKSGQFAGLVDLDYVTYGDPLSAVGGILTSWYGTHYGDVYSTAIMNDLKLNEEQIEMVRVYAVLNRICWLSEKGQQFNQNTSNKIDIISVSNDKKVINSLLSSLRI